MAADSVTGGNLEMAIGRFEDDGEVTTANKSRKMMLMNGHSSQYIKLNVGGSLHSTTIATLVKHDSMFRAMFSGRMEVPTDEEGWVMIDRCGKHFPTILNFLRDEISLPDCRKEVYEIRAEATYYCLQGLVEACNIWLNLIKKDQEELSDVCRVPIVATKKEADKLIRDSNKPVVKLLLNRHNNKYSYTNQSDDNLLKNLELFDRLIMRFNERILFVKDMGATNSEVCQWNFYGKGEIRAEVCCTSIVYATDRKHTKVEFPEARIYEEAMNTLLFEQYTTCKRCGSDGGECDADVQASQSWRDHDRVTKARIQLKTRMSDTARARPDRSF